MANLENKVLNILTERDRWKLYRDYVPVQTLSPVTRRVLDYVDNYWDRYTSETKFSWSDFKLYLQVEAKHDPNLKAFEQFCDVSGGITDDDAAKDLLNKIYERDVAERIEEKIDEDEIDLVEIRSILDGLERFRAKDVDEITNLVSTDIREVLKNSHVSEEGLPFSLSCLQRSIGPVRNGDTIYVPARPEVGKTTFLVQQAGYMIRKTSDTNAIIFSNEENGDRVMIRLYQSILGWTTKEILDDPARAEALYKKALGGDRDRIKIIHASSLSTRDVENACAKLNPDLVVFNLLSKIKGFNRGRASQNDAEVYASQGLWMRELANELNCACMTGWQAGGSAHGKLWVEQDDMYGSKTGLPGEADVILGIGKSVDTSIPENYRFLHPAKNKLAGDKHTDERLRHGYFDGVYIDTERARYYE